MVAQSPIQSNTLLNGQALDVTQYQPPWQALSEFAMSSNFDNDHLDPNHPEFRRLAQQVSVRQMKKRVEKFIKVQFLYR